MSGQGWPVSPCPRSNDGAREPGAQRKAKVGARLFGYFCGNDKSDSRVRRETKCRANVVTKNSSGLKARSNLEVGRRYSLPRALNVFVSRLTRELLLALPQKKPKGLAPTLALRCAAGSLAPSPLRGPARRAILGPTRLSRLPAAQPPPRRFHSACDERCGADQKRKITGKFKSGRSSKIKRGRSRAISKSGGSPSFQAVGDRSAQTRAFGAAPQIFDR